MSGDIVLGYVTHATANYSMQIGFWRFENTSWQWESWWSGLSPALVLLQVFCFVSLLSSPHFSNGGHYHSREGDSPLLFLTSTRCLWMEAGAQSEAGLQSHRAGLGSCLEPEGLGLFLISCSWQGLWKKSLEKSKSFKTNVSDWEGGGPPSEGGAERREGYG